MTIALDGLSRGGRGQVLRSALSLSVLTGQPFVIENIRAKRAKPGLLRQHLTAVQASAKISDASVSGAELGSTTLRFFPGHGEAGRIPLHHRGPPEARCSSRRPFCRRF